MKIFSWYLACFPILACSVCADVVDEPPNAQAVEMMRMVTVINHATLPFKTVVTERMLAEANHFAEELRLPTLLPIQKEALLDRLVFPPWPSILGTAEHPDFPATIYGQDIVKTNIPFESRLRAIQFAPNGRIDTADFEFGFIRGKLVHVLRLDAPQTEYYSRRLNELVGKPSLLDTNGAHQLALRWLAAVDMDMIAVRKLKCVVNQLRYQPDGLTNIIALPLFYVDFGSKHYRFATGSPMKDYDKPQISVEILGTTAQLQELMIEDGALSLRPTLLITNALDLIRTPDATLQSKH